MSTRFLSLALWTSLALAAAGPARADFAHLVLDSQLKRLRRRRESPFRRHLAPPMNTVKGFFQADITAVRLREKRRGFVSPAFLLKDLATGLPATPDEFALLDFSTAQLGIPLAPGTYTDSGAAAFRLTPSHPGRRRLVHRGLEHAHRPAHHQ